MLGRTVRNLLPTAFEHGVTNEADAAETLAALERDAARFAERSMLWPVLVGAWKRKDPS